MLAAAAAVRLYIFFSFFLSSDVTQPQLSGVASAAAAAALAFPPVCLGTSHRKYPGPEYAKRCDDDYCLLRSLTRVCGRSVCVPGPSPTELEAEDLS